MEIEVSDEIMAMIYYRGLKNRFEKKSAKNVNRSRRKSQNMGARRRNSRNVDNVNQSFENHETNKNQVYMNDIKNSDIALANNFSEEGPQNLQQKWEFIHLFNVSKNSFYVMPLLRMLSSGSPGLGSTWYIIRY